MKTPAYKKLNNPTLIAAASKLGPTGKLAISNNKLIYLDIDDNYIHKLYPLLENKQIKKPAYFAKGSAGAHITVIYPEENTEIAEKELGQTHHFVIKDLLTAELNRKTYYILRVHAPTLLQLRRSYQLGDSLCFKGYAIDFHITIANKI